MVSVKQKQYVVGIFHFRRQNNYFKKVVPYSIQVTDMELIAVSSQSAHK